MSRPRTAPRRDAWHFAIGPDDSRRELIISWHSQDGESSCRQRMLSELGIGSPKTGKPVSIAAFYAGLNYWRAEKVNEMYYSRAKAQAAAEAKERNLTPEQAEELTLRNYIAEADASDNRPLYIELSKLRIADQAARTKAETDRAKLRQKDEELRQSEKRLELLQFDASRAALAELKNLKTIAADRTLSEPEKVAAVRLKLFGTPKTEAGMAAAKGAA
jgi:hypothetical protein